MEPLANLAPHLEELDVPLELALGLVYGASSRPQKGVQRTCIHPRTHKHTELPLHQYFDNYIDPSCSLHKATGHILYWIRATKKWFQKRPKSVENTGLPCLDKPVSGKGRKHIQQHRAGLQQGNSILEPQMLSPDRVFGP